MQTKKARVVWYNINAPMPNQRITITDGANTKYARGWSSWLGEALLPNKHAIPLCVLPKITPIGIPPAKCVDAAY